MNKARFFAVCALAATLNMVSCAKEKAPAPEKNAVLTASDGVPYVLDTLNSRVEWKGYKVVKTENTSHFGTIKFESGDITVRNGKLQGGKFVANMNSLTSVDLKDDAEGLSKLNSRLKSGDFFETDKYPAASFVITKVSDNAQGDFNTILEGNLTVKGITKPIRLNANVSAKDGFVTIATEPTDLDREDFNIKFQMPLQNGLIKNEVTVQIYVKAIEQK